MNEKAADHQARCDHNPVVGKLHRPFNLALNFQVFRPEYVTINLDRLSYHSHPNTRGRTLETLMTQSLWWGEASTMYTMSDPRPFSIVLGLDADAALFSSVFLQGLSPRVPKLAIFIQHPKLTPFLDDWLVTRVLPCHD